MERMARTRLSQRILLGVSTLALTAFAGVTPALAKNPSNDPPSLIAVDDAGVLQPDGEYLWQYEIYTGTQPSLSHWVLGVCDDVFNSIEAGSAELAISPNSPSSTQIEFTNPDPSTGATGIKFDANVPEGVTAIYSFETTQDWLPNTTATAYLKAGDGFTTWSTTAPSCTIDTHHTPVVPEPGTLALLGTGALPLLGRLRRRRA